MKAFTGLLESPEAVIALANLLPEAQALDKCCLLRLYVRNPLIHNLLLLNEINHLLGKSVSMMFNPG